ncbi:glutathione synthetase ATP-binding domain-like protein [Aureobasidium sp. EXF-10728]|nr:glutathione synthetase ATP-binding domain-like protein [Aureobasidium sp. EXF-10728]
MSALQNSRGVHTARVAFLYQAIESPVINGVRKPMKPGGYQDGCADMAFNLRNQPGIDIITPIDSPDPRQHVGWSFPDSEDGILAALQKGATHLFANTVVFASHPLQTSARVGEYQDTVKVVGHAPCMVELYDDKHYVNDMLRKSGNFTLPRGWLVEDDGSDFSAKLNSLDLRFPVVGKPVRGRGSHGVKVCNTAQELLDHVQSLFAESPAVILEDYLAGEEATVTILPPSEEHPSHRALPVVMRSGHTNGVVPYNGIVPVTANSRAVTADEYSKDPTYAAIAAECGNVAKVLGVTALMRIDVRRVSTQPGSKFALFDVNPKPNMTGPGRPGRDDQASLSAIAAAEVGWDYPRLLTEMVGSAQILRRLRDMRPDNL